MGKPDGKALAPENDLKPARVIHSFSEKLIRLTNSST